MYCPSEIRANCGFQRKTGETTKKKEAKHPPRKEGSKRGDDEEGKEQERHRGQQQVAFLKLCFFDRKRKGN
jgi:hypothetical protein